MSDRVYQLIEKLYVEMQQGFTRLENKMATKHDIVRIENKMDTNFGALFDSHTLLNERLDNLEEKIDRIDQKVEKHDLEIRVIKGMGSD